MALVAPSILSADFTRLGADIQRILDHGADWVHCDVMDGHLVPNLTFGAPVVAHIRRAFPHADLDCHLMIENPERYVGDFAEAGATGITVHAEACVHLHRTLQQLRELGVRVGVSLNPHTPLSVLDHVLGDLDLVLIMTVNPGFGGQSLIEAMFDKVAALRTKIDDGGHSVLIEVDGGVKPSNVQRFVDAGADVIVSGSGVFGAADMGEAIAALQAAARA